MSTTEPPEADLLLPPHTGFRGRNQTTIVTVEVVAQATSKGSGAAFGRQTWLGQYQ